jgi:hypothetical protein
MKVKPLAIDKQQLLDLASAATHSKFIQLLIDFLQ